MKKIAEVAVPVSLALDETFDYRVPAHCRALLAVGCRVRIPFGRRQLIGYVTAFKNSSRYEKKLKALSDCLDPHGPLLNERLMSLARFLSREYFCSLAQGFETVLPRPLRTSINANIADVPTETTPSTPDPLTKEESAFLKQLDPSKPIYVLEDASRTDRWLAYRAWVKSTLLAGRDALFLVPDVAMIPYATGKLQCGVVPCIISSHEKPDAVRRSWTRAQKGKGALVIGTRSAVFAPFPDPGIIIMEQERHFAYRQQQVPNYHARDVALNLARESGAQLILGSHVPSLEAFGLVRSGQAAPLRFSNKDAPIRLTIVDMHQEFAPRGRSKIISKVLEFRIAEALEKKERLLFFIPQKAFSTYLYCPKCRKPLECERCSSPVSYYRSSKRLVCPSCRQEQEARDICPACLSAYVRYSGFGSEKVESELRRLFPDIRVAQFSKTGRQEEPCD
ncbi:MAG: hypothetical protein PHS61_08535, partial [Candidatus Omnitrophica bacterium]|nr:hypothetical protein [Candidatus Omnitrophota bacterium]